ncbi:hypothetical protein [Pasteurella bettyae]|uniref:hypothetical protein n=1 Tax=Pasteurella bettyae TaxID=752 RepID=UPI000DFD5197|nr:hypothetical protein [Pasteurella bettyae]SUB20765.1 Uncharacterised protein [Pasteurella bettyae]
MIGVKTNPQLAATIAKVVAIGAGLLTLFGGLSLTLSFLLYPILRVILFLGHFGKAFAVIKTVLMALPTVFSLAAKAVMFLGTAFVKAGIMMLTTPTWLDCHGYCCRHCHWGVAI